MRFQWISKGTDKPFYARKVINTTKKIEKATAYVCGLGQFNFYINGEKISDHVLDPGWTKYDKYIEYVAFDVTDNLRRGENVLAAEVGNGWYIMDNFYYSFHFPPFMPPNPNPYKPFNSQLVLTVNLIIIYEDGSRKTVKTDGTWKVSDHMVTVSNVYGSEAMDGRLRQDGWNGSALCGAEESGKKDSFDDSAWEYARVLTDDAPEGKMVEQFQPPIKVIKTYEGKYLRSVNVASDGSVLKGKRGFSSVRKIYDLSKNMSGMLSLEIKGRAGTEIKIRTAEKHGADKDLDQMAKNWTMIDNCCVYTIGNDDVWEKFETVFTYFAGRYISVEGDCDVRKLEAGYITSAWEDAGEFKCDDERLNRIYDMVKTSVEANMLSVHTDCPTIERFAWQEPNHLMAPSIMYMKNGKRLWDKFLTDMRAEQHTVFDTFEDYAGNKFCPGAGLMPSQAPCYLPNVLPVPGMGSFYDIIPWGSTCILGTYWHYMFYGDVKIIKDNYDAGKKYLRHLKGKINKEGFINHGLGDWGNPDNTLARENIETAFLYADAVILAYFAEVLGRDNDRERFNKFAEKIKDNYNKKLLVKHPGEGFYCYRNYEDKENISLTQACEAMPLYWGLVPDERREDVEKAFRYVMERDQSLKTGEVGQPYIIQTMRKLNMNDMLTRFILKDKHPSYYAFILDGETSLGEYWETNPRSHNHDMMGHIIEWYYNGIAGINITAPGAKAVTVKPYLPESVHEFECSHITPDGEISVSVTEYEDSIEVKIDCPSVINLTFDDENLKSRGKKVTFNQ